MVTLIVSLTEHLLFHGPGDELSFVACRRRDVNFLSRASEENRSHCSTRLYSDRLCTDALEHDIFGKLSCSDLTIERTHHTHI